MHDAAAAGFKNESEAYERGRPEYPAEAVRHLLRALKIGEGSSLVDLGAGTGKFTRLLTSSRARITAIEPVEPMREKLHALLPEIAVLDGMAEKMPLEAGSTDAIVCAQAFHWFDGRRALAEIERVLKAGGGLGLVWNVRDESADWVAELTRIADAYDPGAPRHRTGKWREAFAFNSAFTGLERAVFHHAHRSTLEQVVDRMVSISYIAALPAEGRAKVADEVRALLKSHPMTAGRAELDFPYVTEVYWCWKV